MQSRKKVFLLMLTTAIQSAAATAKPAILGHRGARAIYPENTEEGFYRVIDQGILNLELDIGMSRDGTLVIHHDPTINPLICESPTISVSFLNRPRLMDLSDQDLESFDCGSKRQLWRFPRQQKIPGARIPKLQQFLENTRARYPQIIDQITFLIEVKVKDGKNSETPPAVEFAAELSKVIDESGLKPNITVQSFSVDFLRQFNKLRPDIETALLWDKRWLPTPAQLLELGVKVFLPKFRILREGEFESIRSAGFPIIPWTLNSRRDWQKAVEWKLNGIITDDPIGLKAFLER